MKDNRKVTRASVNKLREKLEQELQIHNAKLTGICPVRRSIYNNIFDEILDQITDENFELGHILSRVRDEHQMTLDAYHTLKETSVTYGQEKQEDAENKITPLQEQIIKIEAENTKISNSIVELKRRLDLANAAKEEVDKGRVSEYKEKIGLLEKQNEELRKLIDKYT